MLRYSRLTSTPSHLFSPFLLQLLPADHLHQNTFHAAMLVTKQAPVVNGPELPIMPWKFFGWNKNYTQNTPICSHPWKKQSPLPNKISPLPPQKKNHVLKLHKTEMSRFCSKTQVPGNTYEGNISGMYLAAQEAVDQLHYVALLVTKGVVDLGATFQFWIEAIRFLTQKNGKVVEDLHWHANANV